MRFFLLLFVVFSLAQADPTRHHRSIIGTNDLADASDLSGTVTYLQSQLVARMQSGAGYCTAFRLTETLVMTNEHCTHMKACEQIEFRMGVETGMSPLQQTSLRCEELIRSVKKLDYAIYRVTTPAHQPIKSQAVLSRKALASGQKLVLPSHAATFMKKIDFSQGCRVVIATPTPRYDRLVITHGCDTMAGSSGAPIIDRQSGEVVGIHWGGKGDYPHNHGIRMKDILDDLDANDPDLYDELNIAD